MRNGPAWLALVLGLLSLGALAGGAAAAHYRDDVGLAAFAAVPVAIILALGSRAAGARARARYERTLGRAGGRVVAGLGRALAFVALVLSATALVALAFFLVLTYTQ